MNNFKMTLKGVELSIEVEGYKASRPAPMCSNPDSPRYSDPGDGPEFDNYTVCVNEDIDITDLLSQQVLNEIEERIVEEGEQSCRDDLDDRMSERAEENRRGL
jgi:hypothetical protein